MIQPLEWHTIAVGGIPHAMLLLLQRFQQPLGHQPPRLYCLWRDGNPGGWLYLNKWAAWAAFQEWCAIPKYWEIAPAAGEWRDFE